MYSFIEFLLLALLVCRHDIYVMLSMCVCMHVWMCIIYVLLALLVCRHHILCWVCMYECAFIYVLLALLVCHHDILLLSIIYMLPALLTCHHGLLMLSMFACMWIIYMLLALLTCHHGVLMLSMHVWMCIICVWHSQSEDYSVYKWCVVSAVCEIDKNVVTLGKKATIHQVTTMLATSGARAKIKVSGDQQVVMTWK